MDASILTSVHQYWFGDPASPTPPADLIKRWFQPTPEVDAHIRDTFGRYLDEAAATDWDIANLTSARQAGLVVLLDQFPRQIFRTSGQAFAYDAKAKSVAAQLVADGGWRRFNPFERTFVMLPFEHSEDIADQDLAVLLFAEAVQAAPPPMVEPARGALDFATKHRDIIRRFKRFPHRNAVLGRVSTPEEVEFLKGGRGF